MIKDKQLTDNFKLMEFLRSKDANTLKIVEQYDPPAEILKNIGILASRLQYICDRYNDYRKEQGLPKVNFFISSGYRCPELNNAIKGASKTSQHQYGMAADVQIYINGKKGTREDDKAFHDFIIKGKKEGTIKFDQLINEYNHRWTHIGFKLLLSDYRYQTLKIG